MLSGVCIGGRKYPIGKLYNFVTVAGIYCDKSNFLQVFMIISLFYLVKERISIAERKGN